jgi:transposase
MFKVGEDSESVRADTGRQPKLILTPEEPMSKSTAPQQTTVFCGIDVSAATLAVAVIEPDQPLQQREFANRASGHKALIDWLGKRGARVRVSLEATGIYSLDLALALDKARGIEVAVLNPKMVNRFAQTLRRSKTDAADAIVLAEYSLRMPFLAWTPPSLNGLRLRAVGRHIAALVAQHTREQNRLQAAQSSRAVPGCVLQDLKRSLASLARRLVKMRRAARELIRTDAQIEQCFHLLTGIPGIAEASALAILGELVLLSPHLTVRQWVAHSGLDPAHQQSGTSVHKRSHISRAGNRHLRRALYMPALSAVRWDPHMKAFYEALQQRHKAKLQAIIAVARKLLHAIYGIFRSQTPYDGRKLFPQLEAA